MNNKEDIKKELPENFKRGAKSINLIPSLTANETLVVKTKSKINLSAAISLLILFVFTLIIVAFNIFAKINLNRTKDLLFQAENNVMASESALSSNDEILRRVLLFKDVEKNTYSTKSIINYMQTISKGFATLDTFELAAGQDFVLEGTSQNLTDISKYWYILGNDQFIKTINLKSVSKGDNTIRFVFEGVLNITELIKQTQSGQGSGEENKN